MKAIILALLTSVSGIASASPTVAAIEERDPAIGSLERGELRALVSLDQARDEVAVTRHYWDIAVAGDHPVEAGRWAVRHFNALQARKLAVRRVEAFAHAVRTPQLSSR